MSNTRNNFVFGQNFNFQTQSIPNENVFSQTQDTQSATPPPVSGDFLLLNGTQFKLLNSGDFLLL